MGSQDRVEGSTFQAQSSSRCLLLAPLWPPTLSLDAGIATLSFAFELCSCLLSMSLKSHRLWQWVECVQAHSPKEDGVTGEPGLALGTLMSPLIPNCLCNLEKLFLSLGLSFPAWKITSATPLPETCLSCRTTAALCRGGRSRSVPCNITRNSEKLESS